MPIHFHFSTACLTSCLLLLLFLLFLSFSSSIYLVHADQSSFHPLSPLIPRDLFIILFSPLTRHYCKSNLTRSAVPCPLNFLFFSPIPFHLFQSIFIPRCVFFSSTLLSPTFFFLRLPSSQPIHLHLHLPAAPRLSLRCSAPPPFPRSIVPPLLRFCFPAIFPIFHFSPLILL